MADYVKTITNEIRTRNGDLICVLEDEYMLDKMLFALNSEVDFEQNEEALNYITYHDLGVDELIKLIELDDVHEVLKTDCDELLKDFENFITYAAADDCEHLDQFTSFRDRIERFVVDKDKENTIDNMVKRFEQSKKNLLRIEKNIKSYYEQVHSTVKGKNNKKWDEVVKNIPEISDKKEWLKELKAKKG